MNISLANEFVPVNGDQFEILKFPSHTGFFDHITELKLSDNLFFDLVFSPTNVVLKAVDTRPGPLYAATMLNPEGNAIFTLINVAGESFVIEATTNLNKPAVWTPVMTNVNSGAVFEFIDRDQHSFPQRFFRAYLFP